MLRRRKEEERRCKRGLKRSIGRGKEVKRRRGSKKEKRENKRVKECKVKLVKKRKGLRRRE